MTGEIVKDDKTELEMLRTFYLAWVALHLIPRKEENRQKQEDAAIALTEAAHVVAEYRKAIAQ